LNRQEKIHNRYILVHSPLVSPLTWSRVADEMRKRSLDVLVPTLEDSLNSKEPFWKQHAESVSRSLSVIPTDLPLILVAHSGAGPLLPVLRQSIPHPVRAYVFVDAGIPRDGASRLELMKSEDPDWANDFQEDLEAGGHFPTWSLEDLREVIPDDSLRRHIVAELRPRGLDFFMEPIPVFDGWPDAPCIYLQFSAAYDKPAEQARAAGWPVYELQVGHFHMLVDAEAVTSMIIDLINQLD
jgi:hypothetical protein